MGSQLTESNIDKTTEAILNVLNLKSGGLSVDTAFLSLSVHLTYALRNEMGNRERLNEVLDAVEFYQFQQQPSLQGTYAVKSRSNNRFEGSLKEHPIAAFLVQNSLFKDNKKYRSWQAFVTAIIFSNKNNSVKELKKYGAICIALRHAAKGGSRSKVISDLPTVTIKKGIIDSQINSMLSDFKFSQGLDNKAKETVSAIRRLLEGVEQQGSLANINPPSAIQTTPYLIEKAANAGIIYVDETCIYEDETIMEFEHDYVYQQDEGDKYYLDSDEDSLSDVKLISSTEAVAAQSSYWLRQSQRATLVDRNMLDDFDKEIFSNWLKLELNAQTSGADDKFVFVLGLSFFLGKSLDKVALLKCGLNYHLSQLGYCKKIDLPEGAFKPKPEQSHLYHSTTTKIQLPFVRSIKSWFCQNLSLGDEGKTLSELLGLSAAEILEGAKAALHRLRRQHPKTRIDLRKLSSHLATETSAVTRDPVMVYLLTGEAHQRPPVTSYYQVMSESQMIEAYRNIIIRMTLGEDV